MGHEADGISRNGDFETPLHIAVESSEAVAKLLAQRFPRCIAFRNKTGADPVRFFLQNPPPSPSSSSSLFFFLPKKKHTKKNKHYDYFLSFVLSLIILENIMLSILNWGEREKTPN